MRWRKLRRLIDPAKGPEYDEIFSEIAGRFRQLGVFVSNDIIKVLFTGGKPMADFTIKTARCKGCGICVAFCPKQVLAVDELGKVQVVNREACILCGQCELRCPDYAIFVDKGGAA